MQRHAAIAVDVVIFSIDAGRLSTMLVRIGAGPFAGRWAFPGSLVRVDEALEEVAVRELRAITGRDDVYLEQLRTFGEPDRDPRARVVSTAYLALMPRPVPPRVNERYTAAAWFEAARLPRLAYDHDDMARAKLAYSNIVYGLLGPEFTLGELQDAYEIILGRRLDRRNFRKKILSSGLLRPLPRQRRGAHRPATLYRFTRRRPMIVEML
jgi:8-oxo-dGTP diphosphatase